MTKRITLEQTIINFKNQPLSSAIHELIGMGEEAISNEQYVISSGGYRDMDTWGTWVEGLSLGALVYSKWALKSRTLLALFAETGEQEGDEIERVMPARIQRRFRDKELMRATMWLYFGKYELAIDDWYPDGFKESPIANEVYNNEDASPSNWLELKSNLQKAAAAFAAAGL